MKSNIFSDYSELQLKLTFLRVRNVQLKINIEQCVRNQLKEFPIHESDQLIKTIDSVLKPTDSIEEFYNERLMLSMKQKAVGAMKLTNCGDKKCVCDCTGKLNEFVQDLDTHGGVSLATILTTLGFSASAGFGGWAYLVVKYGVEGGWIPGVTNAKQIVNWAQKELHRHNIIDFTQVDAMESAFLWYLFVVQPEAMNTIERQLKSVETDTLHSTRLDKIRNDLKYANKNNIFNFLKTLQQEFKKDNNEIVEFWNKEIKNGYLPNPNLTLKEQEYIINDIKDTKLYSNDSKTTNIKKLLTIQKAFEKALWFGIDANDVVEINGLIATSAIIEMANQESKLYHDKRKELYNFFLIQPENSPKRALSNMLGIFTAVFSVDNLDVLIIIFDIIKNLPNFDENTQKDMIIKANNVKTIEEFKAFIPYISQLILGFAISFEQLINNDNVQLLFLHTMFLQNLRLNHCVNKLKKNVYICLLLADYERNNHYNFNSVNNIPYNELKLLLYSQKAQLFYLSTTTDKIDENININNATITSDDIEKICYLYLMTRNFDGKEQLEQLITNNPNEFSRIISSDLFKTNFNEQIMKQFD
jgi:hypothetical protein